MDSNTLSGRDVFYGALGPVALGCGGGSGTPDSSSEAGATCPVGSAGCGCYPNLSCNAPFECSPGGICAYPLGTGGSTLVSASSASPLYSFVAKVGHVVSPYTAVYSTSLDDPDLTPTQFTHSFTSIYGDTGAGIAFTMEASAATTVCFNDVYLVRH